MLRVRVSNGVSLTLAVSREQVLSLVERLHEAGVVHLSTYERNMLVQPGPLSAPRAERSLSSPSFRIIDYGRAKRREMIRPEQFESFRRIDLRRSKRDLNLN